jgi:CheY-like chemotaxis protein
MKRIYKVLLAEDDQTSAKVIVLGLERYNFFVEHVPDGRAALARVKQETYDLIITDIMMPFMDGQKFIESGMESIKDTPVIILTAVRDKNHIVKAAANKVRSYLIKPVIPQKLFEKIVEILNIQSVDILDKKSIPFKASYRIGSLNVLSVFFEGCPYGKFIDDVMAEIFSFMRSGKEISALEFNINEDYFYNHDSLNNLDEIVDKITKNPRIEAKNILFQGKYFEHIDKKQISKYKFLSECKMFILNPGDRTIP